MNSYSKNIVFITKCLVEMTPNIWCHISEPVNIHSKYRWRNSDTKGPKPQNRTYNREYKLFYAKEESEKHIVLDICLQFGNFDLHCQASSYRNAELGYIHKDANISTHTWCTENPSPNVKATQVSRNYTRKSYKFFACYWSPASDSLGVINIDY